MHISEALYHFNKRNEALEKEKIDRSTLPKDKSHDHYWIEDERLYESYQTLRGLRFRFRLSVPNMPDSERCSDSMIKYIEKEYLS